jgi:hypothetical protein
MKEAFEKMTGMPDAWTNPALMVSRNAFIQGWEARAQHDVDATIIQYHEATIKRLEKRIEELAQQEPVAWGYRICEFCGCHTNAKARACCDAGRDADKALAQPAQEPDYDALSQKQLASLKRDTRISLEDAAVRATHKVMAELGEEHMKEEWLFPNAVVPVDVETTSALVVEIKRLIDVVGGMALVQRPWVGLTDEDQFNLVHAMNKNDWHAIQMMDAIEAKLKELNT